MSDATSWLLYGVNGFTGRLILEAALDRGHRPVIAGRRRDAVESLARAHDLPHRVFALDETAALSAALESVEAVVHAAGPFAVTSAPMLAGCLTTGTHYLDITGEIAVLESCAAEDAAARAAGITVLPAVGIDVVPTDCLAVALAEALPGATRLELALRGIGVPSRGTMRSALGVAAEGVAVRRGGTLMREPFGRSRRMVPFSFGDRICLGSPLGDVVTAWHSTGIPDIAAYLSLPRSTIRLAPLAGPAASALRLGFVRRGVERLIDRRPEGPDEEMRRTATCTAWGEVVHPDGRRRCGEATTPEGYSFTAASTVTCLERVLAGDAPTGFTTPAAAFGAALLESIEGCRLVVHPPASG